MKTPVLVKTFPFESDRLACTNCRTGMYPVTVLAIAPVCDTLTRRCDCVGWKSEGIRRLLRYRNNRGMQFPHGGYLRGAAVVFEILEGQAENGYRHRF